MRPYFLRRRRGVLVLNLTDRTGLGQAGFLGFPVLMVTVEHHPTQNPEDGH